MFSNNLEFILKKFEDDENSLNGKLQQLSNSELEMEKRMKSKYGDDNKRCEAKSEPSPLVSIAQRNAQMRREIEMSRAKMRSLSLYSPLETHLHRAITNYSQALNQRQQSNDEK